jgi:hypothetical protein
MSITRANAESYETDAQTVSGRTIKIRINDAGYYRIDVEGVGDKPQICEHIFTSLNEARKAVSYYIHENAAAFAKEAFKAEMVSKPTIKEQRKAERAATRNDE